MKSYLSELDTMRFGFKIAKVNNFDCPPNELIQKLKADGIKMIISRVECEKIQLIHQLEELNFLTMDFQIIYKYDLEKYSINEKKIESDFIVREAKTADIEMLVQIAKESFEFYGHYFADKRLAQKKCMEIYMDWIKRSCESKEIADIVFVAEKEKEIGGFLSFKLNNDKSLYAAGVQGAVSLKFRNQNIFRLLALQGLIWGVNKGCKWEEHNVLVTNYPVNRSFLSIGFKPYKSFITMHCWLD